MVRLFYRLWYDAVLDQGSLGYRVRYNECIKDILVSFTLIPMSLSPRYTNYCYPSIHTLMLQKPRPASQPL